LLTLFLYITCDRRDRVVFYIQLPLSFWIWGAFFILALIELFQEIDLADKFHGGNPIQEGYHLVIREYLTHVLQDIGPVKPYHRPRDPRYKGFGVILRYIHHHAYPKRNDNYQEIHKHVHPATDELALPEIPVIRSQPPERIDEGQRQDHHQEVLYR
jgi:hypothetical protein